MSSTVDTMMPDLTTPPDKFKVWESVPLGLFLTSIIVISIGGNVLVCVAILTDRKLRGTVSNLLLMSLAVSDLVVSSLVMPFAVAHDILGFWPFAIEFCNIWISLDILSATASILNLCAISLDRYIHMKKPFRYGEWMTKKKCVMVISLIWLASILISFLPISVGWHKKPESLQNPASITPSLSNQTYNYTTVNSPTSTRALKLVPDFEMDEYGRAICVMDLNKPYALISSSISFYIPCIVMVAIYSLIYRFARKHAVNIKKSQAKPAGQPNSKTSKLQENKALFTLGMIMGLFLLCWIPFFIVNLVSAFHTIVVPEVFMACVWLGYLNSTMNPIIYSKFNADFRSAFKKILTCRHCRNIDPYLNQPKRKHTMRINSHNGVAMNGHTSTNGHSKMKTSGLEEEEVGLVELSDRRVSGDTVKEDINDKEDLNDNFL